MLLSRLFGSLHLYHRGKNTVLKHYCIFSTCKTPFEVEYLADNITYPPFRLSYIRRNKIRWPTPNGVILWLAHEREGIKNAASSERLTSSRALLYHRNHSKACESPQQTFE